MPIKLTPFYTIANLRRDIAGLSDDAIVSVYACVNGETHELPIIELEAHGTSTEHFVNVYASDINHAS